MNECVLMFFIVHVSGFFVSNKLFYFFFFSSLRVTVFSPLASFVSCPSSPWIRFLSAAYKVDRVQCSYQLTCLEPSQGKTEGGWSLWGCADIERSCSQQRLLQSRSSSSCLLTALVLPPRSPRTLGAEWDALCLRRRSRLSSFHLLHKHTAIRRSPCLYCWLFFHEAVIICFSLISAHLSS